MITSAAFAGKRYAVLGLARTGMAAVRALLASGAQVTAWDNREEPRQMLLAAHGDRIELADPVTADLTGFDGVVVSPGVPLNRHPIADAAARFGVPVIGDIELFALARADLPPHRVVGITGTNGKSTTTALVHHLLTAAGVPSWMGGNIGLPVLGQDPLVPNAKASGVYGVDLVAAQPQWPSLQGPHNLQNAAAAVAVVSALGLTEAEWRPGLATFKGLPHRMERVAEAGGVLFINDSKATNPASAAPALAAFPPVDGHGHGGRRIHWIVGGLPKGDDLDECAPWFGNVAAAYIIGDAGPRFAELLEPYVPVWRSEMMCEAIRQAIADAAPGDVVLLSPACASFDQVRDYEARGDSFRQLVGALLAGDGPS